MGLPSSQTNKAGRTIPVKFSLRIAESVDAAKPFVQNEELRILIYAKNNPSRILQESHFGSLSIDYRIAVPDKLYITNFKTLTTPQTYVVGIYRGTMLIGTFEFKTTK